MLVIVPGGFMCLALILANYRSVNWGRYKVVLGLVAVFVTWQVLVVFISSSEIYQQLFGFQGRNTGLITYLAFSFIFVGSVIASNDESLKRLVRAVFIVGSASVTYGVIQALGADPLNWAANGYSPVFGFLGNPNFQSSLLGVLGVIAFDSIESTYWVLLASELVCHQRDQFTAGFLGFSIWHWCCNWPVFSAVKSSYRRYLWLCIFTRLLCCSLWNP